MDQLLEDEWARVVKGGQLLDRYYPGKRRSSPYRGPRASPRLLKVMGGGSGLHAVHFPAQCWGLDSD